MSVLVVGSVALDSVKTTKEEHHRLLGGSASYASVAASFFAPTRMVGIVGEDFPPEYISLLESRGVDLAGLQRVSGKTFAWSGEYELDMNRRKTLSVELNVFEQFRPDLPAAWKTTPIILLANIAPVLQLHVLDQLDSPKFVVADTMDLWIHTAKDDLLALLKRVDLLVLNDSEAKELTGRDNLIQAGREMLRLGPKYVAIKKGEHGCLLFGEDLLFAAPAYPVEGVVDPTGAGDCFIGGFVGSLAATGQTDFSALKRAVLYGTATASFDVEDFSLRRLQSASKDELLGRVETLKELVRVEF